MNRVLSVSPTCAWPILEEVGQCMRCRPLAPSEAQEKLENLEVSASTLDEIARTVTGQMPSMAVSGSSQKSIGGFGGRVAGWLSRAGLAVRPKEKRT